MRATRTTLLIGTLGALLGACRDQPPSPDRSAVDTLRTGEHAALSDAQVLHALIAATEIGAATATRAAETAQHIDVELYAQVLRADHAALQTAFADLATNMGVQPADNEVSRQLQVEGTQALARIQNLDGPDFDRAFVDAGIQFYQTFVEAYDARLLPSARQQQLREVMRAAKPTFEAHLQRAAQLRAELAGVQLADEAQPATGAGPGAPPAGAQRDTGVQAPTGQTGQPAPPRPPPAPPPDTVPRG